MYSWFAEKSHLTATGRHLPYGITQCYLPPDTSECNPALRETDLLISSEQLCGKFLQILFLCLPIA